MPVEKERAQAYCLRSFKKAEHATTCPTMLADQKANRKPKRNCRSSSLAPVMVRKFELPRVVEDPLEQPPGLQKCGELKRFAGSTRNCRSKRSVNLNVRNKLKSKLTDPGPSSVLRPTFPYVSIAGALKALGS